MAETTEEMIRFKREELYELVWAQPVTKLAKSYGLSDVGFAKICRKLKVPIPGRGYWQRKGLVKRPPLLATKGPVEHVMHIRRQDKTPACEIQTTEEQVKITFENLPENQIHVMPVLRAAHPLVALTEKSLKSNPDKYGRIRPNVEGCLNVVICPDSIDRAMRILDALIKGLEARGFAVSANRRGTFVSIMDENIEIGLEEHAKRIDRKLTPLQKKELEKQPWMFYEKYDYVPSGVLSLKIQAWSCGNQKIWSDGRKRLEDRLNAFVIGLIKVAEAEKIRRLEQERRERERQEREQRQREIERQIREEKERVQALERDALAWHKGQLIRAYIEAVKEDAIRKHGEIPPGSELYKRLLWAEKQADLIDPLIGTTPDF